MERKWHKSSPPAAALAAPPVTRAINVLRPETPLRLKRDSSRQDRISAGRNDGVCRPPDSVRLELEDGRERSRANKIIESGQMARKNGSTRFVPPFSVGSSDSRRNSLKFQSRREDFFLAFNDGSPLPLSLRKVFISKRVEIRKRNKSFRARLSPPIPRRRQQMKGIAQHLHKEKTCPAYLDGKKRSFS